MSDRGDRTGGAYIGAYAFGERASERLRRAEKRCTEQEEVLAAIGVVICNCAEIVGECKASVDRIEGLLRFRRNVFSDDTCQVDKLNGCARRA
jgi:hypothetical protein